MGLIHRDVKPGNIMVGRRGGEVDHITVLDFGQCRAADKWGEEEALRWWERYGKDLVSEPARTGVEEMSGPTLTAPRPTLEYTSRHDSSLDG